MSYRPPEPADVAVLVTDSDSLLDALVPQLRWDGFDVRSAATPDAALAAVATAGTCVVVLDVATEGVDAKALCRSIGRRRGAAVIVLSSAPSAGGQTRPTDLVEYLEAGADDYLSRPERHRELVARMRAVLRRRPTEAVPELDRLTVGDVVLDRVRHEVTVAGAAVSLTLKQFQLLELFLAHPGQVLPRATILRRVWGSDSPAESNTLEVQVKRLRRKIELDPLNPTRIRTVRGIGYLYANR